jgi:uncharacterized protein
MPAQTVIDSLEFARTGQMLSGDVPIPGMGRLKDNLHDELGEVRFEVRGALDGRGRPVLAVEIRGMLHLQCQRCLGVMEYPLLVSNTLLLTAPGAGDAGEEEAETVEASSEFDVAGLVEDEIILSLPFSPRHAEGACRQAPGGAQSGNASAAFGKLAALKRKSH